MKDCLKKRGLDVRQTRRMVHDISNKKGDKKEVIIKERNKMWHAVFIFGNLVITIKSNQTECEYSSRIYMIILITYFDS